MTRRRVIAVVVAAAVVLALVGFAMSRRAPAPPFLVVGHGSDGSPILAHFMRADEAGRLVYRSPSGEEFTR